MAEKRQIVQRARATALLGASIGLFVFGSPHAHVSWADDSSEAEQVDSIADEWPADETAEESDPEHPAGLEESLLDDLNLLDEHIVEQQGLLEAAQTEEERLRIAGHIKLLQQERQSLLGMLNFQ